MFGWLKNKIENASVDAMRSEIVRFTTNLRGATSEEISLMLVIANSLRLNLVGLGRIPPAALDLSIPRDRELSMECERCPIILGGFIKQFQKMNQPSDALGAMIWLHSVRALNNPEIRILGREMWGELVRGFQFSGEAIEQVESLSGTPFPENFENHVWFIPHGLEPQT